MLIYEGHATASQQVGQCSFCLNASQAHIDIDDTPGSNLLKALICAWAASYILNYLPNPAQQFLANANSI